MTGSMITVVLPLAAIYLVFLLWYRGSGKPLTREEIDGYLAELRAVAIDHPGGVRLEDVERLLEHDDGREFVMQNLIRYREKALYPPGHDYGDSARAADRRYGKAILPHLLRFGIAITRDATLLTRNTVDFAQVPGLRFENWLD